MLKSNSVEAFDLSDSDREGDPEYTTLTLWVPKNAKEKYDRIQELCKKKKKKQKYSEHLKSVVVKDIESVKLED